MITHDNPESSTIFAQLESLQLSKVEPVGIKPCICKINHGNINPKAIKIGKIIFYYKIFIKLVEHSHAFHNKRVILILR